MRNLLLIIITFPVACIGQRKWSDLISTGDTALVSDFYDTYYFMSLDTSEASQADQNKLVSVYAIQNGFHFFDSLHIDDLDIDTSTTDSAYIYKGIIDSAVVNRFVLSSDPGADRILFWDESSDSTDYLTIGQGLSISSTTLSIDDSVHINDLDVDTLTVDTAHVADADIDALYLDSLTGSFYEGPKPFTAGVTFGGGSTGITYTSNVSTAVKLGKAVFFSISIALSNKGSSTGTALITGLPYTSSSTSNLFSSVNLYGGDFTFADYPQAYVDNNATTIALTEVTNAGTATVLTSSDFTNTTTLYLTGMYFTD